MLAMRGSNVKGFFPGQDEDPLNTDDDDSDDDQLDMFDTDNVVVCQYDKVTR